MSTPNTKDITNPIKIIYRVAEVIVFGILIWVGTSVQSLREDISAIKVTNSYMQETRIKVESLSEDVQENRQDIRELKVLVKENQKQNNR